MSFLTAKSLPRRTVLRGLGATLALPFLDAMVPASSSRARAAAAPAHRFQTFYVPNGMAMEYWTPKGEGAAFELSPILEPLAPFRNQMLVLSGLKANWNYIHAGASGSFLTGTTRGGTERSRDHRRRVDGPAARAGNSRSETQVASLELAMDPPANAGACTGNLSCVYTHTLSLAQPDAAAADGIQPARGVREAVRRQRQHRSRRRVKRGMRQHKSILDSVTEKLASLKSELGPQDQTKVNEYTEAVRDVERRIQKAEEQRDLELPTMEQPQGVPPVFEDHLALMLDLQLLAFQSDLTRVISFMIGKEQSARPYPQIGVPEAHHPLSHHGNMPELIARMSKINRYHTQLFSQVSGEAARDAGRRRLAAGSHDDPVRLRHFQQQPALRRQPADPAGGRRRRDGSRAAGISQYDRQADDGQPAGDADGQAGRAGRARSAAARASCRSTRCRACSEMSRVTDPRSS